MDKDFHFVVWIEVKLRPKQVSLTVQRHINLSRADRVGRRAKQSAKVAADCDPRLHVTKQRATKAVEVLRALVRRAHIVVTEFDIASLFLFLDHFLFCRLTGAGWADTFKCL